MCLIIFWHEGCFWFGCLPSLSSVCVGYYPLDRESARALPGRHVQQLAPGCGALSGSSRLCPLLGSEMAVVACTHPWSFCRQCLANMRVHGWGKKLLWRAHPSPGSPPSNGTLPLWRAQASSCTTVLWRAAPYPLRLFSCRHPQPSPQLCLYNLRLST